VCDATIPELDDCEKLRFLAETRQSFGRTALVLSGGASLGIVFLTITRLQSTPFNI